MTAWGVQGWGGAASAAFFAAFFLAFLLSLSLSLSSRELVSTTITLLLGAAAPKEG